MPEPNFSSSRMNRLVRSSAVSSTADRFLASGVNSLEKHRPDRALPHDRYRRWCRCRLPVEVRDRVRCRDSVTTVRDRNIRGTGLNLPAVCCGSVRLKASHAGHYRRKQRAVYDGGAVCQTLERCTDRHHIPALGIMPQKIARVRPPEPA